MDNYKEKQKELSKRRRMGWRIWNSAINGTYIKAVHGKIGLNNQNK
jgi:hypothetical protein